jgi:hypothetical protein
MKTDYFNTAMGILARAAQISEEDLYEVYMNPRYRVFSVPKRNGSKRKIHAPVGTTKKVQHNLYHIFLKKIGRGNILSKNLFGGVPGRSTIDNFNAHIHRLQRFIVKLDLQDAFHCVDERSLKQALHDMFQNEVYVYREAYNLYLSSSKAQSIHNNLDLSWEEIQEKFFNKPSDNMKTYLKVHSHEGAEFFDNNFSIFVSHKERYLYIKKRPPLFPVARNRWFRELVRSNKNTELVHELCEAMASILARVLTLKGSMVQGCPTSPILMALMVQYTGLIQKIERLSHNIWQHSSSVYVDDIVLNVNALFSDKKMLEDNLKKALTCIEKTTIWRFNPKKVRVYDLDSNTQPVITGLRLVRHRKTKKELLTMKRNKVKGAVRCLKAWEPWWYPKPTIPKQLQRVIRSCLHNACRNQGDKDLQIRARSYLAYVFMVYSSYQDIPLQIRKKLDEYCSLVDESILVKYLNKIQ